MWCKTVFFIKALKQEVSEKRYKKISVVKDISNRWEISLKIEEVPTQKNIGDCLIQEGRKISRTSL